MRQRLKTATAEFVEGQLVPGLTRSYRQPQRGSRPACVLALGVPESRCLAAIDGRHCAAEPCVGLGSDRLNVGQSCFLVRCRRILSIAPQAFMLHHRLVWLRLVSRNSQRQWPH
jgi:hypothetical protein